MKTKILSLFLLGCAGIAFGQEIKIGQRFTFKAPAKHTGTDLKKAELYDGATKNPNYLEDGIKYEIADVTDKNIIVKVDPPFRVLEEGSTAIPKASYYNYKLFTVTKEEFLAKAEEVPEKPDRFSVGILTLPFKFRPQDEKTFEAQFNLNSTLNWRVGKFYSTDFYVQIGAGLGSVELNSNNSLGIEADKNINAATLTMFSGLMLQYKKVQAGIYCGVDQINNQKHYQWNNNGNLWFGFGVGYQLFNVDLGGDTKKSTQ
ncbi:hypothetical protein PFY12_06515 [Chryseobacterium camelliae]|uniref:Outer membrane protein beta-barrel domain-containing protein n=1 Tax=Chryseobacterium camelliae TaxID=1265445 RepID=A0ABY7QQ33_9FLAO|nr:hypothetical protein [Chryseobacterium camelliae]WBV61771.1 hypothetical protein PFY12_06515 [Chryseobacterium camelliae]